MAEERLRSALDFWELTTSGAGYIMFIASELITD